MGCQELHVRVCGFYFEYYWAYCSAFPCLYFPCLAKISTLGWEMLCRQGGRECVGTQFLIYPPRTVSVCITLLPLLSFASDKQN